jgi:putative nucleotidyltransferase with HDIG domain
MNTEYVRGLIINSVHAFPAISQTATEALRLLSDPNSDFGDIERVVRVDPGLTANVLKLANSAYFGLPGGISSVRQAVARIGWNRMRQLMTTAAVNGIMEGPVPGYDLKPGALWRHAVGVSVAAETLAKEHDIKAPADVFTAALLHDIGKLLLGKFVEPYFDLIEMAVSRGLPFDQAEREVLGTDHAEAGAWVLEHWSFPPATVAAVRLHHRPDEAEPRSMLVDLVHLADLFCLVLGVGIGEDGIQYLPSMGSMARVGLAPERLRETAELTLAGLDALDAVLKS